jgi:UDP-glucose 4-epimerase
MKRVLVIGGSGFIGDYLIKNLSKENLRIISLYNNTSPSEKIPGVKYLKTDARNRDQLIPLLENTDYLVILSRPDKKIIKNIIDSGAVFEKILYASTILIYPNSKIEQDEKTKPFFANQYEKEKIAEEKKLINFSKKSGNKLLISRLTNVYGDVKNRALIHWILSALINDREFVLNNEGKPVRDFIFVEDAAMYLAALLLLPQKDNVSIFNVCTGSGYSILEVIAELEKITGRKLKIKPGAKTQEKSRVVGNNEKIINFTGRKPGFSLKSGLAKAYRNYLK